MKHYKIVWKVEFLENNSIIYVNLLLLLLQPSINKTFLNFQNKYHLPEKLSAGNCGNPAFNISLKNRLLLNGPSLPSPSTEGSSWEMKCALGYIGNVSPINCSSNGQWSDISPCYGM